MSDKNILAYFKSPEEARGVAAKLQAMRAADVQIDRISRYRGDPVDETSAGILMATDPSASGMSDGGQGGPTGRDILLTAVVDEQIHEKALQLVKDSGGMV